jgi:acetyltransferase
VINPIPTVSLNASFSARMPSPGNISFISIGNKADVDEPDLLQFFREDPDTAVVMLYVEELRKGVEFIRTVKEITSGGRPTPVLAIKSGRTMAGAAAAASHTGALAGTEAVYDAIFKQSGLIRADSMDELFDYANVFAYKQESKMGKRAGILPKGNRVAIVTNAGGPGILATDMTVSSDLLLAKFEQATIDDLASHLPPAANIHNPVDIIGDVPSDRYSHALQAVILRIRGWTGRLSYLPPSR